MKNILACSRLLAGETMAAKTALQLAEKVKGNVFLMNLKEEPVNMLSPVLAGVGIQSELDPEDPEEMITYLLDTDIKSANVPFTYIGEQLEGLQQNNCRKVNMVVTTGDEESDVCLSNPAAMFKSLDCPVLKLSSNRPAATPKRIAYVTDLRYFDRALFSPFMELYRPFGPEIMVVHITASGLPDIENCFAESLFTEEIAPKLAYKKVSMINLLGHDTVNDMQNVTEVMKPDMIVLGSRIPSYYDRLYTSAGSNTAYADLPVVLFN